MSGFTSIISAIKPRDRTDKIAVLAALYVLKAHRTPVTVKQLNDVLSLNLGAKSPANVPSCLRRLGSAVEPAEKGPPIKWSLLSAGLDGLRTITGLALPSSTTGMGPGYDYDIAIVCALEEPEFTAVQHAMGGPTKWKVVSNAGYPHVYREAILKADSGKKLRVVATTSTSMGLTAAAIATTHLVLQFRPRLVVMVGIAAGTRSGKKQFGDVLVADPSIDYMSGKIVNVDGSRQFQPDPYPIGIHPRLRTVLRRHIASRQTLKEIRARWPNSLPPGPNKMHLGPLGAADQVVDDHSRMTEIQLSWRKLIGLEMETYGVYRACLEAPEPKPLALSFKSVCDFAESKTDEWQEYAAFVAANFAIDFLRIEWDALWPSQLSQETIL
jgi:nucleoside phosphorylase